MPGIWDIVAEPILEIINKVVPDKTKQAELQLELAKLAQSSAFKEIDAQLQANQGQVDIDKIEAASETWWKAGWRPFIGWVGGISLAYAAILEPLARFIAKVGFDYAGEFPAIDTDITMQIVIGMLGFGGFRTYEKLKSIN